MLSPTQLPLRRLWSLETKGRNSKLGAQQHRQVANTLEQKGSEFCVKLHDYGSSFQRPWYRLAWFWPLHLFLLCYPSSFPDIIIVLAA